MKGTYVTLNSYYVERSSIVQSTPNLWSSSSLRSLHLSLPPSLPTALKPLRTFHGSWNFYPVLFAFCNHKSEGCWPGLFVARHLAWLRTDYISVVSAQRTSGIYANYIFFINLSNL